MEQMKKKIMKKKMQKYRISKSSAGKFKIQKLKFKIPFFNIEHWGPCLIFRFFGHYPEVMFDSFEDAQYDLEQFINGKPYERCKFKNVYGPRQKDWVWIKELQYEKA